MKLYTSKQWLRRKYEHDNMTAAEIAKLCGVTEMTVTRYLNEFGLIKKRK